MKYLADRKLLIGKLLDYGCGNGFDAAYYKTERYDIYYAPFLPTEEFDTITCIYVLNVVSLEDQIGILNVIKERLSPKGNAYIAVRRDIPKCGTKTQDYVVLDCPEIVSNRRFVIYHIRKDTDIEKIFKRGNDSIQ